MATWLVLSLVALLVSNAALLVWALRGRRWQAPWQAPAGFGGFIALVALWVLLYPRDRFVQLFGLWAWPGRQVVLLRGAWLALALLGGQILAWWGGVAWLEHVLRTWQARRAWQRWRPALPLALGWTLALGGLAWLMARTGFGLRTTTLNWYEPLTPLLPGQFYLGLAVLLLAPTLRLRGRWGRWAPAVALWALAFFWWGFAPARPAYFAPPAVPPTNQVLPWSDAQLWDLYGWQLLLGLGPDPLRDHMGYAGLLALLHRWLGTDYRAVELAQVALLAVLPVLVYALGTALGSRVAGLVAGFWLIAQGANALQAGNKVNNQVHPRMLMTEWPTALLLALATWALLRWARGGKGRWGAAALAGGALALATMFRSNALALLPAFALGMVWLAGRRWRRGLAGVALLVLGAFLVWGPWMMRAQARAGTPWFFLTKVVWALRPEFRTPLPGQGWWPDLGVQAAAVGGTARPGLWAAPVPEAPLPEAGWHVAQVVAAYWAHNLATHFFALPFGLRAYDLEGLRRAAPVYRLPFWQQGLPWPGPWPLLLAVYLLVLGWGLAAAWRRARWAGWVPLGVALAYHLATAVARTGGARYLVPVLWVLWLYVALGVVEVLRGVWAGWGRPVERGSRAPLRLARRWDGAVLALLAALPLWMAVRDAQTPRYPPLIRWQAVQVLRTLPGWAEQTPLTPETLAAFWRQEGAVVLWGEALYPRYYAAGEGIGEPPGAVEVVRPYPRLVGYLLFAPVQRQGGFPGVVGWSLPQMTPAVPSVWGEAVVVGCQRPPEGWWYPHTSWVDVVLLGWRGPDGWVWLARDPWPNPGALTCPLPAP